MSVHWISVGDCTVIVHANVIVVNNESIKIHAPLLALTIGIIQVRCGWLL